MLSWLFRTIKLQTCYYEHWTPLLFTFQTVVHIKLFLKGLTNHHGCMGVLTAQEKCNKVLVLNELYTLNIIRYIKGLQRGQEQSVFKGQRLTPLAWRIPRGRETEKVKAVEHPATSAVRHCHSSHSSHRSLGREPRHSFTSLLQEN